MIFYLERAVSYDIFRSRPINSVFFDDVLRHYTEKLMRQQTQEKRCGLTQTNSHRVIVNRFNADVFSFNCNERCRFDFFGKLLFEKKTIGVS